MAKSEAKTTRIFLLKQLVWCTYLAQASPDLGLDRGIHLLFINGHGNEFVQNCSNTLALGIIVVLTEAN